MNIVIVGAGTAGSTAARILSEAGHEVAVCQEPPVIAQDQKGKLIILFF